MMKSTQPDSDIATKRRVSETDKDVFRVFASVVVSQKLLSSEDVWVVCLKVKRLAKKHDEIARVMPSIFKHFIAKKVLIPTGRFILSKRDSQPRPLYKTKKIKGQK